jgi:hypothetical protein
MLCERVVANVCADGCPLSLQEGVNATFNPVAPAAALTNADVAGETASAEATAL